MASVSTGHSVGRLRPNAIGLIAAATLGIVFMGPAPSFYGVFGPVTTTSGGAVAFLFILGGVVVLPTAISYAQISKRIPSAGSAYTWLGRLINRHTGNWLGWMMLPYYILVISGPSIIFGLFFNILLADIGLKVGMTDFGTFALGVLICFAVAATLAAIGIRASTRVATIVVSFECLLIFALSLTILIENAGHLSLAPLDPTKGLNFNGFWAAFPLAFAIYTGFDVISAAAEETKLPRKSIPRATIASVLLYGLFMAFAAYCFFFATSFQQLANFTNSGLTPVGPIATQYWGHGDILIAITGLTSGMGATLAIIVGTSRIMFAMARDKALPEPVARLHPKHSTPWFAIGTIVAIGVFFDLFVGQWIGALNAYAWGGTAITWFALILYMAVNVGYIILAYRDRETFRWAQMIVPVVGVVMILAVLYKSFVQALWDSGWVVIGRGIVVFAVAWTILGFGYAYLIRNHAVTPRLESEIPEDAAGKPGIEPGPSPVPLG